MYSAFSLSHCLNSNINTKDQSPGHFRLPNFSHSQLFRFAPSISSFSLPGLEIETKDKVNSEDLAVESPTSVLEDETMAEEEEKLLKARIEEEEVQCGEAPDLSDTQFNKLDELLTRTKLYSEFLLEKMDDIALAVGEQAKVEELESNPSAKRGRGLKRKAASQCNTRRAKRAVAAMLTRSKEGEGTVDMKMTEEALSTEGCKVVDFLVAKWIEWDSC
ncbi:hypothetical protein VNO80_15000 [Phaseolus coccineus]|uniref:Uncharacterized protein n=1 Tax=Phaseolus coccineus TaxID=3886 RepID=A0AAN9MJF7_PHACN